MVPTKKCQSQLCPLRKVLHVDLSTGQHSSVTRGARAAAGDLVIRLLVIELNSQVPRNTPPKARFAPSQNVALGLFHLPNRIAAPTLTQFQRVLNAEAPPPQVHSLFLRALGTMQPTALGAYSIAASYAKAAEAVGCQVRVLATQSLIQNHFLPRRQPNPRGFPPGYVGTFRVDRGVHSHHRPTQPIS